MAKHFGTRKQGIGGGCFQTDLAVAIGIHAIVNNICWQHLHHADFSGPGTFGSCRAEFAPFVQFQRCKNLRTEQLGAAAIMRQGHQRVQRVEIALIAAVVRFKGPERQKNSA